jgi:hypothetical protein
MVVISSDCGGLMIVVIPDCSNAMVAFHVLSIPVIGVGQLLFSLFIYFCV